MTSYEPPVSNIETHIPCISIISLIISSSARICRAYSNDDIQTVHFVTFVCFTIFLLYYCFELNQQIPPWEKSPKKHKLLIGIWILMSGIMFGLGCKFPEFMSSVTSFSFFMLLIGANFLLLHFYSVWFENKNSRICYAARIRITRLWFNGKANKMNTTEFAVGLDNV